MWEGYPLHTALLGQPVQGDPRQIVFGATHIDKRQLQICRNEPVEPPRRTWLAWARQVTRNWKIARLADWKIT